MTTMVIDPFPQEYDLIAIGASLGGLAALRDLLSRLPSDFRTPIVIVQHRSPEPKASVLVHCLQAKCKLPVMEAMEGEPVREGCVYLAPPNKHLTIGADHTFRTTSEAKIFFSRPSVNALFYSVARNYGSRAIGVILTGANADGAHGVVALKVSGARVLVQQPNSCKAPQMPNAAINSGCVDLVLSLNGIANALISLTMVPGFTQFFPVRDFTQAS